MIYNVTQHEPTSEQIEAGVRNLPDELMEQVRGLMTVDDLPETADIERIAEGIAEAVMDHTGGVTVLAPGVCAVPTVMIGGAPWLMSSLERSFHARGFCVLYAFSLRRSKDCELPTGKVVKKSVFEHIGFVKAVPPSGDPVRIKVTCGKCRGTGRLGLGFWCDECSSTGRVEVKS